jgi:hypothetical protein
VLLRDALRIYLLTGLAALATNSLAWLLFDWLTEGR